MVEYLTQHFNVTEVKATAAPRPRLDAYGYTPRGGSPTDLLVRLDGRGPWRRVYVLCFSNCPSYIVKVAGKTYFTDYADISAKLPA